MKKLQNEYIPATSVHQWKPVSPERYAALLHEYQTMDVAMDEFGNGRTSTKAYRLDKNVTSIITYIPKMEGSSVSSPVLMTIRYESPKPKVVCFSSLSYGIDVDSEDAQRVG